MNGFNLWINQSYKMHLNRKFDEETSYWRCPVKQCPASASVIRTIDGDLELKLNGKQHIHLPDPEGFVVCFSFIFLINFLNKN